MALGIAFVILLALAISFFVGSAYLIAINGSPVISPSGKIIPPWVQGADGLAASAVGFLIGWMLGMLTWMRIWAASNRGM